MGNRKIMMHEYRHIIYRLQQGDSDRAIARDGLVGRNKVKLIRALCEAENWLMAEATLPEDKLLAQLFEQSSKEQQKALAEPHREFIEQAVQKGYSGTVIHRHLIDQYSFTGSYNTIQRFVKKLHDSSPVKLTVPLHFKAGEAAQVDFGQGPVLFDQRVNREVKTWFFVMVLCWSRHQYVELVAHQDIETWLRCHQNAFVWFGGVVGKVIIDNAKCAITKACYNDPQVQRSYAEFAEDYRFRISACPPRDPQKKGRVEAGVKYVRHNFLPFRTLNSLQDANSQLKHWITGIAGNRCHGSTFKHPMTEFTQTEYSALTALPAPLSEIAVWIKVSLYRDCHVRHKNIKYSAPHTLYGEELWLKSTPTTISIYHQHELVAMHSRLFIAGDSKTKDEHLPPKAREFFERDEAWCLERSASIGESCHFVVENLLTDPVRDLLRQAQSVLKLSEQYGAVRLNKACARAVAFASPAHKTIKKILKEGLDYEQLSEVDSFNHLSAVYQGNALYQRQLNDTEH